MHANTSLSSRCLMLFLAVAVALTAARPAAAEDWPGWRGPRGDGSSLEKNVPTRWSGTDNVAWKVAIPGKGHASPIIWGDRIFLVTNIDKSPPNTPKPKTRLDSSGAGDRVLLCLDRRTGRTLWQKTVLHAPLEYVHKLNSRASSTPVADGKLVYVSFLDRKQMFIAAYDFEGNQVWAVRPGVFSSVHGYCSSPILWKDTVIVNGDHDGPAYIVALDRATGKTIWKTPRPNNTRSYCTPIIRNIEGRNHMLLSGSKCVASFDPDTGKQRWIIDGPTQQYVASLVYNGDMLFLTCGFPEQHIMGIRPNGKGNVTKTHVAWHHITKDAAYVPSPAALGPYFFLVDDFGMGNCYEAATGETVWREKLGKHFSASMVTANGLVYITADEGLQRGETGVTTVIRPGKQLDVVSRNILGEPVYGSPAISRGQIFLRGDKHLYCIGTTKAAE